MISHNLNLQKFLIKFQKKTNVTTNNKDILLRFKEKMWLLLFYNLFRICIISILI